MKEIDPIQNYTGWLFRTLNNNKKARQIMMGTKNPVSDDYPELIDEKFKKIILKKEEIK